MTINEHRAQLTALFEVVLSGPEQNAQASDLEPIRMFLENFEFGIAAVFLDSLIEKETLVLAPASSTAFAAAKEMMGDYKN